MRNTQQSESAAGSASAKGLGSASAKGLRRLRRGARPLPLLLVVAVGLAPMGATLPCRAQGAASVTPAQRSAALAGAHALVGKMLHLGVAGAGLTGMAQILSNRSAGAMGVMMAGVLRMGIGSGGGLSGGRAQTPGGPSLAGMRSDYAALRTRWGLGGAAPASLPPAVAGDGRGFLADVAALVSKAGMERREPADPRSVPSARDFAYTVLSPTRVRMAVRAGAGGRSMPPSEAVLEAGQWRLDLGNLKALSSHASGPPAAPGLSAVPGLPAAP